MGVRAVTRRLDRFQALAVSTTTATYLLIAVGGLVRAAGAGLGCPDWPKCFDRWIPPVDASGVPPHIDPELFNFTLAWTEYVNRLLGVVVGFLILATAVAALVRHRHNGRVLWPTLAAFVLVLFQGWLGGQVVASGLKPWVLTAHLVLALVIVTLLLYATVQAFFPAGHRAPRPSGAQRAVAWATAGAIGLVLVQVGLGALVRGEVQLAAEDGLPRGEWLGAVGVVHTVHRSFAIGVSVALILLWNAVRTRVEADPWLGRTTAFGGTMLGIQVAAGIGLAEAGFPAVLQVVHLWAAALLLGALSVQWLLLFRLDPRLAQGALAPSAHS